MTKTSQYRVLADGWVLGQHRMAGDVLPMTEAQAKYQPNVVRVEDASEEPAPRKSSRRRSDEDKADA